MRLKALKLRMMPIATRRASQDFLRQERLAPRGHEPFGVEIARVNCPQAHGRRLKKTEGMKKGKRSYFHFRRERAGRKMEADRKSTRLNSSHVSESRMP